MCCMNIKYIAQPQQELMSKRLNLLYNGIYVDECE